MTVLARVTGCLTGVEGRVASKATKAFDAARTPSPNAEELTTVFVADAARRTDLDTFAAPSEWVAGRAALIGALSLRPYKTATLTFFGDPAPTGNALLDAFAEFARFKLRNAGASALAFFAA